MFILNIENSKYINYIITITFLTILGSVSFLGTVFFKIHAPPLSILFLFRLTSSSSTPVTSCYIFPVFLGG